MRWDIVIYQSATWLINKNHINTLTQEKCILKYSPSNALVTTFFTHRLYCVHTIAELLSGTGLLLSYNGWLTASLS